MRAARLHTVGDLRLSDEPVPVPGTGESLVRVMAIGICGSDLHWWDQGGIGDAALDHPLVLGHEAAGVIEDGPRRGQRVAIDPAVPDGTCRPCREGYRNLCLHMRFAGHGTQDGAMREFMTWPDELLHPLPEEVSDADGAVLEPLGVAIHALDLGHVRLSAPVVVVGAGPIGLLIVQLLQVAGAGPVTVFEPLPHRRAAAAALGAAVADPAEAADPAALRGLVGRSPGLVTAGPGLARQVASLRTTAPYAVARVWLDGDVAPHRMPFSGVTREATLDSVAVYSRFEGEAAAWAAATGGCVLELHAYAAPAGLDADQLAGRMLTELAGLWPETRGLGVVDIDARVREDAPGFAPGSDAMRPGVTTDAAGVRLAGDWVRLGFPSALMERAAASGMLAAGDVLTAVGAAPEPVVSVPPRGLLARRRPAQA